MERHGGPRGTPPGGTKAGDDPSEAGLHSLSIGAATTLAAGGGEVSQRVIQREGRWKSSSVFQDKVNTRNSSEDAGVASRE